MTAIAHSAASCRFCSPTMGGHDIDLGHLMRAAFRREAGCYWLLILALVEPHRAHVTSVTEISDMPDLWFLT